MKSDPTCMSTVNIGRCKPLQNHRNPLGGKSPEISPMIFIRRKTWISIGFEQIVVTALPSFCRMKRLSKWHFTPYFTSSLRDPNKFPTARERIKDMFEDRVALYEIVHRIFKRRGSQVTVEVYTCTFIELV